MVDGVEGESFDEWLPFRFSPDGTHFAYGVRKGANWMAVLDGREGMPHEGFYGQMTFSPVSGHVAYVAKKNIDKVVVVVDGEAGGEYDNCIGLNFESDGSLQYLAFNDRVAYRVRRYARGRAPAEGAPVEVPTPGTNTASIAIQSVLSNPTAVAMAANVAMEHVVQKGETLSVIARAHGVSVTALMKANNIPPGLLVVGGKLVIPQ